MTFALTLSLYVARGVSFFMMGMLAALCIGYLSFVRWKIRLKGA